MSVIPIADAKNFKLTLEKDYKKMKLIKLYMIDPAIHAMNPYRANFAECLQNQPSTKKH